MKDLLANDQDFVWHPFTQAFTAPIPLSVISAKDATLYTEDGKEYLDANSSWWTVNHGHGNKYIADKIYAQFMTLYHVIFAGVTHPIAVEVSERIIRFLPPGFRKVFFSDNGSTSVEVAIKMVYQYWHNKGQKKQRFLALEGAYHGDTFGAMSVGQRDYFNAPFEHLFFDVDFVPFPTEESGEEVLQQIEELFKTGEFAGFIFEPLVQGAAGMRIYDPKWLGGFIALAKKYEVLTVADEVMTGFYRTGTPFAIHQIDTIPDIICLSKGVTGGILPIGLTVAKQAIYDAFLSEETAKALLHGHSFTGNPLSCAAISASLDLFEKPETLAAIQGISDAHLQFIQAEKDNSAFRQLKSIGTILSIELEVDEASSYFSSIRERAYSHFLNDGILLRPLGNVIFVNPPYCIKEEELEKVYASIRAFVKGVSAGNNF